MKKTALCMTILILAIALLASCTNNTSSSPLSVTKIEATNKVNVDSNSTKRILSLFKDGKWIDTAPNCRHDFVFDYNGDMYHYHSACGAFYSLTDKLSLKLGKADQTEVNDILKALFD